MSLTQSFTITRASLNDAQEILELQKLAYQSEARLYNDFSIPPPKQMLAELQEEFSSKIILKALLDNQIVGSVRGYQKGDSAFLERLIVHPDYQKRGIGTQLIEEFEALFPEAKRLELFTGYKSISNIRLYNKSGYTQFKKEKISDSLMLVFMEKIL
jgi:GNAT superfamily N-acetyltransferase